MADPLSSAPGTPQCKLDANAYYVDIVRSGPVAHDAAITASAPPPRPARVPEFTGCCYLRGMGRGCVVVDGAQALVGSHVIEGRGGHTLTALIATC